MKKMVLVKRAVLAEAQGKQKALFNREALAEGWVREWCWLTERR